MGLCQTEHPRATAPRSNRPRRPLDLSIKAEALLHDMAYVLHLTRAVKRAMLDDAAPAPLAALAHS